jgi:PAS domain-containing protein
MDIVLEGEMTGIEAAEEIRNCFGIPVIYLTAYSDRKTVDNAKETMPYGFLLTPVNEDDLRTTVETALHKHEMERKLEESEQRFKSLFEYYPEAVCSFDLEDNPLSVNPVFNELTGYSVEELTHMSFKDFIVRNIYQKLSICSERQERVNHKTMKAHCYTGRDTESK